MALMIYNTLTRKKEEFKPIEPGKVRMYVCGMTVYDYCHLGHARVLVAFDVIVRFLRARGLDVTYVRNITDIDDKILRRAAENGEAYEKLTERFIAAMHEDEKRLGILPPTQEPRATQHIGDIIALIEKLIANGYAYSADNGDVYYAVAKFDGYGKLSGKNPDELLAGARIEIDEAKRDPRDFALWKSAKPNEEAVWQSPWGAGRPGWHIECSAMSGSCLGETFDIHGGGPDLKFPHHENEIAQSEAATGKHYVNYWMHAGAVRIDGEKMSKSLGNFFTIRDIFSKNWKPEVIRYLVVNANYRTAIDYSDSTLSEAKKGLDRLYHTLKPFPDLKSKSLKSMKLDRIHFPKFVQAMDDDFNTSEALGVMFELANLVNRLFQSARKRDRDRSIRLASTLKGMGDILGVLQQSPLEYFQGVEHFLSGSAGAIGIGQGTLLTSMYIENMVAERIEAKKSKNFSRADELRKELLEQGVVLEDRKDGTTGWRRE